MQASSSARRVALLLIFVVSGFTGLIYESIWSHYLKLFLGHAAYAQTLVLAIFMGGMALGSWLVARYSVRLRSLLFGYVIVEGVIGLCGLIFHKSFVALTDLSFESVIPALGSGFTVHAFKWTLAALLILPQSTLLGMTFPMISGGLLRRWPERPGETLSVLYFTNSLGAAIGVLVSGFVLIRMVGLPGTIMTAGLLNVALAIVVWALIKGEEEPAPAARDEARAAAAASAPGFGARWFLIAAFVTGAASFLYEIGWIRMLSLVLGSSTHSFELMLSAFIFGLAFGGLWMRRRIDRIANPMRYLGIVMILMGALALLTLPAYGRTFDFMAWALGAFTRTDGGYTGYTAVSQLIAVLIMVPTTFLAGMTLPLLTQALRVSAGERAIGAVYAANTLGAIVGVLCAVHVFMPLLGVKGVIVAGASLHMALGLSGLASSGGARMRLPLVPTVTCAVLVLAVALGVSLDARRMTSGVYRTGSASQPADTRVIYLRDGKTATISLVEYDGVISIATNGKPDAAIRIDKGAASPDEITMVLAGALALGTHDKPARIANIGFGSGLTSHTVLGSPRVERLDSIEIEPFMVEAAQKAYLPRIRRVFEDPRSHIIYEDAKTYFSANREPYDVIISEPSNPWVSGVATLFSAEFYEMLTRHLKPDGRLIQWLQIYETDINILASIVKALSAHFSDYVIYNADDSNILIVAARQPLAQLTLAGLESPELSAELAHVGIRSLQDIERRRLGNRRTLQPLLETFGAPPNSDFFPYVDLNAPRLRFMQSSVVDLPNLSLLPLPLLDILDGGTAPMASHIAPPENSRLARDFLVRQSLDIRNAFRDLLPTPSLQLLSKINLTLINSSETACKTSFARETWRSAVHQTADLTSTYLPAAELQPIWSRIQSSACYSALEASERQWVDLLAAVADRDVGTITNLSKALLSAPPPGTSADKLGFALVAGAAAQIGQGRDGDARELLEKSWNSFVHPQIYEFPLRQLLALSRSASRAEN